MVESYYSNSESDEDADPEFTSMLAMNTIEQQIHNSEIYPLLLEMSHTSAVINE